MEVLKSSCQLEERKKRRRKERKEGEERNSLQVASVLVRMTIAEDAWSQITGLFVSWNQVRIANNLAGLVGMNVRGSIGANWLLDLGDGLSVSLDHLLAESRGGRVGEG